MPTRVSSGGLRLPPSSFESLAPAYAETARSLAGRATELYELASGLPAQSGEPPLTGVNPQGLVGWDLSGPPWGSAVKHQVVWFAGRSDDANLIQPETGARNGFTFSARHPATITLHFWNRPFDELRPSAIAPYSRLHWVLRGVRLTGATTPTLTLRTWNNRMGQRRDTGQNETQTAPAGTEAQITVASLWVPCHPGWNIVNLEITLTTTGYVGVITSGGLSLVEKRSH